MSNVNILRDTKLNTVELYVNSEMVLSVDGGVVPLAADSTVAMIAEIAYLIGRDSVIKERLKELEGSGETK